MIYTPEVTTADARLVLAAPERPAGAAARQMLEKPEGGSSPEQALLGALHLLMSRDDVDLEQMLRHFARAIEAPEITLYVLSREDQEAAAGQLSLFDDDDFCAPNDGPGGASGEAGRSVQVKPASAQEHLFEEILHAQTLGWVLPIVSPTGGLHGYLDALPAAHREGTFGAQESRSLHYLCSLLAGYFDRCNRPERRAERVAQTQADRDVAEALDRQQAHISQELHDNVGQLLTSIRMLGENLAAGRPERDGRGRTRADRADRIAKLAGEAAMQVSEIHRGLAAPDLCETTLAASLEKLAGQLDDLSETRCFFHCDEAPRGALEVQIAEEVKLQLYRIAQEAANNAVKHARARRLHITLEFASPGDAALVLHVRDDGQGFASGRAVRKSSSGLRNMAARARAVGGTFQIETAPGAGTTVTCTVPGPS